MFQQSISVLKQFSHGIALLCLLLITNSVSATQLANYAYARIDRTMTNNEIAVIKAPYGQTASKLEAGKSYFLAVKTEHQQQINNRIVLYFAKPEQSNAISRYVEFLIRPELNQNDWVATDELDGNYQLLPFTLPESANTIMHGRIEAVVKYHNGNQEVFAVNQWQVEDKAQHALLAQNPNQAIRTIPVNLGYVGSSKTPDQLQELAEDLENRFNTATKGYVNIDVNLIGSHAFPENGTFLADDEHNYIQWWNSLPKLQNQPGYVALDPENQDDLNLIRMAWYEAHPRQLNKDVNALFGLDDQDYQLQHHLFYVEAGYRFSGARYAATVGMLTNYGNQAFRQRINGEYQYGFNAEHLTEQPSEVLQKIALHEFGHTLGFQHPQNDYVLEGQHWKSKTNHSVHESVTNIMTQGTQGTTNKFFMDDDILRIVPANVRNTLTTLPLVAHNPVAHNVSNGVVSLSGNDAAHNVLVNDMAVNAHGNGWTFTQDLNEGDNTVSVSRLSGELQGHPQLFKVQSSDSNLQDTPEFELQIQQRPAGRISDITLLSSSARGIKSSWFWVYKIENGSRQFKVNLGRWMNHNGEHQAQTTFRVVFEAGQYEVCGRARDTLYGTGTQSQSGVDCHILDF